MASHRSQLSDICSSSVYEGDRIEPIDYIPFDLPSELQPYTPGPSNSLQTTISVLDSDFTRLDPPLLIPNVLERVGPNRAKAYVLYSTMSKQEFINWWLQTDFGKKKHIRWDTKHHAECWKHFEQVADGKTGKPGVMCTHCNSVLEHPTAGHTGTSSMNKHISGPNCRKSSTKKLNIQQAMQHAVC